MHTLDTNAIIYYLNGELSAARILDDVFDKEEPIYVSAMTELELFSHRLLTDDDSDTITRLKAADSAIAATALLTHTTLITRNIRDFQQISRIDRDMRLNFTLSDMHKVYSYNRDPLA